MTAKIYRYNFSADFIQQIEYFAKVYKYEDRHEFKEKWDEWLEDNSELVDEEKERLTTLGYDGDIESKMYTSARYYFSKKISKTTVKKRKTYVAIDKSILGIMDEHILENYANEDYTQKNGFEEFYTEHEDLLTYEDNETIKNYNIDLKEKFKKTYKNRYYLMMKKIGAN